MSKKYYEPFKDCTGGYRSVLYEILKKRGFYNQEIVFKWKQIVGEDLANLYIPHSIKYKHPAKKRGLEAEFFAENAEAKKQQTLYLYPKNGRDFYKFAYYKLQIVQKIEVFFSANPFTNIVCSKRDD